MSRDGQNEGNIGNEGSQQCVRAEKTFEAVKHLSKLSPNLATLKYPLCKLVGKKYQWSGTQSRCSIYCSKEELTTPAVNGMKTMLSQLKSQVIL